MTYPESYRYTKEHEWVNLEGDTATVGITFHAQQELGDIVYVDLPKIGAQIEKGKSFCSVESVKAVSDVFAPIGGEVTAINEDLIASPEKLNEDPHGVAWIVKLKVADSGEINSLLTPAEYQSYVGAEH